MDIHISKEWLRWGDVPTDFVGFFAPIEEAYWTGNHVFVRNKYGTYYVDPKTQEVTTDEGIDWYTLSEVAKYGMGYKFWEKPST